MTGGLDAIKHNVRITLDQIGPLSDVDFGLNRQSVEWVEGYVERLRSWPGLDEAVIEKLSAVLGSFLGECIAVATGGSWRYSEEQAAWCVDLPGDTGLAFPIGKVEKLFRNGLEAGDSILSFYDIAVDFMATGKLRETRNRSPEEGE